MTVIEMMDFRALTVALIAGAVLGSIYFGSMWWVLLHLPRSRRPALLFVLSLIIRLSLLLSGFYLILQGGHLDRLLAAIFGFILVRVLLTRKLGSVTNPQIAQSHSEVPS